MRWHSYHVLAMSVQDEHEEFFRAVANLMPLESDQGPVTIGEYLLTAPEREQIININESTFIPIGTNHRLENPGVIPLTIIEVQSGEYLGEDDIVRFDDVYGRC